MAVCLLPGTEVAFEKEVEHERSIGFFFPSVRLKDTVARFLQVNKDQPNTYHDALEFPDATVVLLSRLCEGQRATVLQLPVVPRTTEEAHEQKRGSVVA